MKLYVLVEGAKTEKIVHRGWLSHWFPSIQFVSAPEDAEKHSAAAFMISGNGYPSYKKRIESSLKDLQRYGFYDWFVIIIDAEDQSEADKRREIDDLLAAQPSFKQTRVIVQACCIETWFLAHRRLVKDVPSSPNLQRFKDFYDVRTLDPEGLPDHESCRNRADTHYQYVRAAFAERNVCFTKTRPGDAYSGAFMCAIWERYLKTGHIRSFGHLVSLYREIDLRYPQQRNAIQNSLIQGKLAAAD